MSRIAEPLSEAMALLEKLEPGAPAKVQANLDPFSASSEITAMIGSQSMLPARARQIFRPTPLRRGSRRASKVRVTR